LRAATCGITAEASAKANFKASKGAGFARAKS
jgi:hypothetical protein